MSYPLFNYISNKCYEEKDGIVIGADLSRGRAWIVNDLGLLVLGFESLNTLKATRLKKNKNKKTTPHFMRHPEQLSMISNPF